MPGGRAARDAPPHTSSSVVPERAVVDTGRRRWCMSSGSPECLKVSKSSLGRARANTIRSSRDSRRATSCRRGRLPDRRGNASQPGRRRDLLRRKRRPTSRMQADPLRRRFRASIRRTRCLPIKTNPIPPAEAGAAPRRSPPPSRKTSRTSSNCPRPTANRRWRKRICPVTGAALGSMGVPVKITLRGQTVFLCCQGCIGKAKRSPDETLKKLAEAKSAVRSAGLRVSR